MTKMKPSENKISKLRVFYQVEKQILISTRPSRVNFWFLILGRISHSTRSKRAPTMERFPYSAISADRLVSCWAFLCWPSARLSTPSFKLVCRLADDWSTNAGEWIKTEFYNRLADGYFYDLKYNWENICFHLYREMEEVKKNLKTFNYLISLLKWLLLLSLFSTWVIGFRQQLNHRLVSLGEPTQFTLLCLKVRTI
jgi:hypothetical protein